MCQNASSDDSLLSITTEDAKSLKDSLEKHGSELVSLAKNPVDEAWGKDRPSRRKSGVFPLDVKYAGMSQSQIISTIFRAHRCTQGKSSQEKIKALREVLKKKKAAGLVVNMLDEVAWLFNLRGSDIDFNPGSRSISLLCSLEPTNVTFAVFLAFAVVTSDESVLFVDDKQINEEVRKHLGSSVEIQPYESVFDYLKSLSRSLCLSKEKVSILDNTHIITETSGILAIFARDQCESCSCRSHRSRELLFVTQSTILRI